MEDVEIDQEAHWKSAEAHVGQQLGMVDGVNGFYRFHFYDDSAFDYEIHPITEFEPLSLVDQRQTDLSCYLETSGSEFVRQAGLVGALQKARAEDGVDLHGGIHDRTGDVVYAIGMGPCWAGHG
jgi:hypothetical protein